MFSFLPWALGLRIVDDVIGNLVFIRQGQRALITTVSSQLVLTPEELAAWNDPDTAVENRVAIFKRGLLRYNMAQRSREVS